MYRIKDVAMVDNCRPRKPLRFATAAILAALLLFVAGHTFFSVYGPVAGPVFKTGIGGFQKAVLQDGTKIELNTDSELRVRFTRRKREIVLVRGEAHFDVAKDADRPFVVRAGYVVVRAVGTAFTIRMYTPSRSSVLVTEGRVTVGSPTRSGEVFDAFGWTTASDADATLVSAGERAMDNAGHIAIYAVDDQQMAAREAWRTGWFVFSEMSLSEIVAEFNRYQRRQITIGTPSIATLRFNGRLNVKAVDKFLAGLAKTTGIRAREVAGQQNVVELQQDSRPDR